MSNASSGAHYMFACGDFEPSEAASDAYRFGIDMTQELKPCPMCGSKAHLTKGHCAGPQWPGDFHRVYCGTCQLRQLFYATPSEAVTAWNRRALLSASIADTAGAKAEMFSPLQQRWIADVIRDAYESGWRDRKDDKDYRGLKVEKDLAKRLIEILKDTAPPAPSSDTAGAKPVVLGYTSQSMIDGLSDRFPVIVYKTADKEYAVSVYLATPAPSVADAAGESDDDDIEEAREILESLISNIRTDCPYSADATITFIQQALNCLPIKKESGND